MRLYDFGQSANLNQAEEYERERFDTEQELESVLNQNPNVLLGEQIFIFSRQPSLDPGLPDLLGLDQYGNVVVFELKKGLSGTGSASEETILSQPQNYARALGPFGYDDLNDLYQAYQQQIRSGEWDVDESLIPAESLDDAFETVFGQVLKPEDYNQYQRMVIVAETITGQTAENARYLQDQGLYLQAQEVQLFESPNGSGETLTTTVVVDYDDRRVRPSRVGNPTYDEVNQEIFERAYPQIQSLVGGSTVGQLVNSFDNREPRLRSEHPDHPETVEFSLRVKPRTGGLVRVTLDVDNDKEAVEAIREHAKPFEDSGFEVSHTRSRHRVVMYTWEMDNFEPLNQDEMLDEIAETFARLVELSHEVFTTTE
ncbi:hypothetical protein ACFQJ7_08475 [Halovenus rubra]|uniref:Uncharacterized protein n=2 Tax=Halovenus rubra TaxID=869890 RepID=A0ACC7E525_9EURY|nr:hypothetical protein [Halovenus rubra]